MIFELMWLCLILITMQRTGVQHQQQVVHGSNCSNIIDHDLAWFGVSPHRTRKSSQSHGLTCLISDLPRIFQSIGGQMLGKWFQIMIFPTDFSYWNGYSVTAWVGQNPKTMRTCFDFQKPCRTTAEDAHAPGRPVFRGWQQLSEGLSLGALLVDEFVHHFMIWITRSWGTKDIKVGK